MPILSFNIIIRGEYINTPRISCLNTTHNCLYRGEPKYKEESVDKSRRFLPPRRLLELSLFILAALAPPAKESESADSDLSTSKVLFSEDTLSFDGCVNVVLRTAVVSVELCDWSVGAYKIKQTWLPSTVFMM